MLSKEDTEDQSEKKISRLQLILKLLEEDQVEQSVSKEKAAGGSILIRKMSETKPLDGTAHGSEQISPKAAGGGMPIHKMSETKPPDGTAHGSEQISPKATGGGMPIRKMSETKPDGNASEKTDVKESTADILPEKPPLCCKLTGLFTLQKQIIDAEENSGHGSDIHKISEAQSENPEKPVEGIGKSKETGQTSMQETGESPTMAENKTEGSSTELQIHKIEDTESRYSDGTVDTADTVDKDLSKDEFDSDLVIDKGECDTKGENQKRVAFKLDIAKMESVKSSHNPTLDSSQETVQTTVTQTTTDDSELTVTFTDDTQDDDDYLSLSQNVHRAQYIKTDDSSDSEQKWSDLEPGDKLQR